VKSATFQSEPDAPPLLDEVRSDRCWPVAVAALGSTVPSAMGGLLVYSAITVADADIWLRLIVGGLVGGAFFVLFGAIALALLRRLVRAPRRVRIDARGVQIGERHVEWNAVRAVRFSVGSAFGRPIVKMSLRLGRFAWIHVPGFFSGNTGAFIDRLDAILSERGVPIPIEVA
jgi:hypothetical protein